MFLVIADTSVGEALHLILRDLNFLGFKRLFASMDTGGLLNPNIMYFTVILLFINLACLPE